MQDDLAGRRAHRANVRQREAVVRAPAGDVASAERDRERPLRVEPADEADEVGKLLAQTPTEPDSPAGDVPAEPEEEGEVSDQ